MSNNLRGVFSYEVVLMDVYAELLGAGVDSQVAATLVRRWGDDGVSPEVMMALCKEQVVVNNLKDIAEKVNQRPEAYGSWA